MKRCLVTGHKGFIGSSLFQALQNINCEVKGVDLKNGDKENILNDVLNTREFLSFKPEYIFHLACFPRVGFSIENPILTMKNNVLGSSIVLDYAKKVGTVKRVIYSSSSSVVGKGEGPTSPYALQKLTTEMECKIYSQIYGIDTVALRYFNVYCESQKADGPYATAICNWMHFLRQGRTPFITGDGEQRRDMVHLDDVVKANIFAMNCGTNFNGQHLDIGTGRNISLNEIKQIVQKYHDVEFEYREPRAGEVPLTKADVRLAEKFGFKTCITIEEGLNNCFNFEVNK